MRGEKKRRLSSIRFAFYAAALHSNRGAVQQCVSLGIPLVLFRTSYDFLRANVSEADPGSRSRRTNAILESVRRTMKKKIRTRLICRESLSSSLEMLRKFKLLSHKRGIKKFAREAVFRGAKSAHERGVPLFLLSLKILARPLTEFDHLSARYNSQKK